MTLWSIVYGCWVLLHMTCIVIIPCKEKYPTNLPLSPSFKIPTEFLQFYRMKYIESQGWHSAAVCTVAPLALALVHDDYEMVRSAHIVVNCEYLTGECCLLSSLFMCELVSCKRVFVVMLICFLRSVLFSHLHLSFTLVKVTLGREENTFWFREDAKNFCVKNNVISNTYK